MGSQPWSEVREALGTGPGLDVRREQRRRLLRGLGARSGPSKFGLVVAGVAAATLAFVVSRPLFQDWANDRAVEATVAALAVPSTPRPQAQVIRFGASATLTTEAGSELESAPEPTGDVTVVLKRGRLNISVQKHSGRTWRYRAGPFEVEVVGTTLWVDWRPERQRFEVAVTEGAVMVKSSKLSAARRLSAGERYVWGLERGVEVEAPLPPQVEVVAAAPELVVAPPPAPKRTKASVVQEDDEEEEEPAVGAPPPMPPPAPHGSDIAALATAHDLEGLAKAALSPKLREAAFAALEAETHGADTRASEALVLLGELELGAHRSLGAAEYFQRSLKAEPYGPFAERARGGRLVALAAVGDRSHAQRAAVEYLQLYPNGARRELAQRLSAGH